MIRLILAPANTNSAELESKLLKTTKVDLMYSVVSTALQMRFEFQKCATFDVFAFPAGSVCFHIKYFWIRQVELVCL